MQKQDITLPVLFNLYISASVVLSYSKNRIYPTGALQYVKQRLCSVTIQQRQTITGALQSIKDLLCSAT